MPFSAATAITRLTSGPVNAFKAGISSAQQLQCINEVLERFYEFGTWRGLHDTVTLTSSSGIITLSSAYQRLDGLGVPAINMSIPIKTQQWAFSTGGPKPQDWTLYGQAVALDLGDNASGQRQYQLSGNTTSNDALSYSGLCRKRFTWITNTATIVFPDTFQALRMGVLARGMEDEGANNEAEAMFNRTLAVLNGNLQEFEPEEKQVVMAPEFGFGSTALVH